MGAHERAVGQLSSGPGNLVGQAEKLKSMGIRTKKDIPPSFAKSKEMNAVEHDGPELSFPDDDSTENRQSA